MKDLINIFVKISKDPRATAIYMIILIVAVAYYFYSQLNIFAKILETSRIEILFLVFIPYLIIVVLINPYIHYATYQEMGVKLSLWQVFRIFHLSRIGNYVPGRVWFALNYYLFSRKLGIDIDKIARNFIVLNALFFLTGGICSLPIIHVLNHGVQMLLFILLITVIVTVHPKILNKVLAILPRKEVYKDFTYNFYAKIGLLYFISYLLGDRTILMSISFYDN